MPNPPTAVPTPSHSPATTWGAAAASGLITIAALFPFRWVIGLTPMTRDAAIWLDRSATDHDKLFHWLFQTQHFQVGYRPVTGLSYLANDLMGGSLVLYRLTDFGLHAACVALVHALVRRWSPASSPWAATAAAAVMAAHPIIAEVVPHLARRGYPLASMFALAGLLLFTARKPAADALACVALALGALSNEAAYVAIPVAAMAIWDRGAGARSSLFALAGTLGTMLAARIAIIGGIGGYAAAERGSNQAITAGLATWSTLVPFAPSADASGEVLPSSPVLALALLLSVALFAPVSQALRGANRPLLWAAAWLFGLTAVFLPNGVWFPRQVYMLVPPMALLVGLSVGLPTATHALFRVPAVSLLLLVLVRMTWVTDPDHRAAWEQTDQTTKRLIEVSSGVRRMREIQTVLPYARRPGAAAMRAREGDERRREEPLGTRINTMWAQAALRRKRYDAVAIAFHPSDMPPPFFTVTEGDGYWDLTAKEGVEWYVPGDHPDVLTPTGLRIVRPDDSALYADDGAQGRLLAE